MAPGVVTPKEDPADQPTSVRLPKSVLREIDRVTKETRRSRNETIVQLLRYALDAHFGRKPAE